MQNLSRASLSHSFQFSKERKTHRGTPCGKGTTLSWRLIFALPTRQFFGLYFYTSQDSSEAIITVVKLSSPDQNRLARLPELGYTHALDIFLTLVL